VKAWILAGALALATTQANAQTLKLEGQAGQHAVVTAAELAALPHETIKVVFHGQAHAFEGAPLAALLAKVGAPAGEAIKGRELATVVRVTARDGYQVVLGLAETDPGTRAGRVIVADREDGRPLGADDGPFRLVVSDDLRPARSARQVERLEVLNIATTSERPAR
jgi:hypothetical protein